MEDEPWLMAELASSGKALVPPNMSVWALQVGPASLGLIPGRQSGARLEP